MPRWERQAMSEKRESPDRMLPTLAKLPMLTAEAKEPTLPARGDGQEGVLGSDAPARASREHVDLRSR
jgi:hypothetical protein